MVYVKELKSQLKLHFRNFKHHSTHEFEGNIHRVPSCACCISNTRLISVSIHLIYQY